jgi:hypothetical protein
MAWLVWLIFLLNIVETGHSSINLSSIIRQGKKAMACSAAFSTPGIFLRSPKNRWVLQLYWASPAIFSVGNSVPLRVKSFGLEESFCLLPGNPVPGRDHPLSLWDGNDRVYNFPGPDHGLSAHLPHLDGWYPFGGQGNYPKGGPLEDDAARDAYEAFQGAIS